jgi:hypothetical protein
MTQSKYDHQRQAARVIPSRAAVITPASSGSPVAPYLDRHDRLAQRDDDDQPEAFDEVRR